MFDTLTRAVSALRKATADVDPQRLSGADATRVVAILTEAERVVVAARTLAARRVEASKVWQRDGHRSAAEWMARTTGTSVGQAIGVLETAKRLEELPLTREAFRSGGLSEIQAREVSDAAYADPRQERALVESARTQTVKALRVECARVKAAAVPDELARYESIRRRRFFRHRTEADGAVRLDARLTPDTGAEVIAAIDVARSRHFNQARREDTREASEAYAADALVELVTRSGDEPGRGPRAMVHVRVDHDVLLSGVVTDGQRCEIDGVGPIPAQTARSLTHDAILKGIVTKGCDVQTVVHVGRTVPTRLRTALEARDPVCVVPGCDRRHGLEIDHYKIAYADGGATSLENLARLCRWHHYLRTHCGYRLTGGPGRWRWVTPDDREGDMARRRDDCSVPQRE